MHPALSPSAEYQLTVCTLSLTQWVSTSVILSIWQIALTAAVFVVVESLWMSFPSLSKDVMAMMTLLGQIFQTRYDLWKGNTCTEGQTLQYFGYFNSEVYSYIPDEVITLNVFYYLENINGYFFRSVVDDDWHKCYKWEGIGVCLIRNSLYFRWKYVFCFVGWENKRLWELMSSLGSHCLNAS